MGSSFVGIGGWSYDPWRTTFYPKTLKRADELGYASRQLTAIEINVSHHRIQPGDNWKRWREQTPDGFVFAVKAWRLATYRKSLLDGKASLERFLGSGLEHLGDRLGPILWQLAPTKVFSPKELEGFFGLLPRSLGGRPLRHVLEPRHESFFDPAYLALARRHGVATAFVDSDEHPCLTDDRGDLVYARFMRTRPRCKTGYSAVELDAWATRVRSWLATRDVYAFFVNGAKERAPAAAQALIARLSAT